MSLEIFNQRVLPMKDTLFRFAFSYVQHWEEAEDIVQEVMGRIWDKRREWPRLQNLEGYCMTMTRNLCIDKLRSRDRQAGMPDHSEEAVAGEKNPYEQMVGKELAHRVHLLLGNLPEKQRMVMQLREIEGRSYQEIAEVLDLSIDQVKVNLFRGRTAIKNELQKQRLYGIS